ncbi:hypothetical protein WOLCODRAFT_161580 [Wolfiporia cocos MD-104 SS10]|uniref:Postreplication repair E3 ubiquitin-protein ligase RAD18 n=1 Tax=Wolfiporia cocos (strain MD-104) TaxID=742152 RepID=A0A2H3JF75_WOLCO|nr:hypothetical protein WOLCODRAFT_161580 [Wolfiporia cocos MD-104 SS10]
MVATDLQSLLDAPDAHDPTDFPPQDVAPGLRLLDDSLRCSVCRDFYDAPMSINCGHSFCSLCIRQALDAKQECPSCRQPATEAHLRKNTAAESAVKAWSESREFILRLSKAEERRHVGDLPAANGSSGHEDSEQRPRKRQRTLSEEDSDAEVEYLGGTSPYFSSRGSATNSHIRAQETGLPSKSQSQSDSPLSEHRSPNSSSVVECPLCQRRVPLESINQHIDSGCTLTPSAGGPSSSRPHASRAGSRDKDKQKAQWTKLFDGGSGAAPPSRRSKEKQKERASEAGEAEYLPKVAYATLKDRRLQEMLAEHGLPTAGDRAAWERRHQKWVTLYNANADRAPADQQSPAQLKRALKRWEDGLRAANARRAAADVDAGAHQRANSAAFRELVEAARPKKAAGTGREGRAGEDGRETTGMQDNSLIIVQRTLDVRKHNLED